VIALLGAGGAHYPRDFADRLLAALRALLPGDRALTLVREADAPAGSAEQYQAWLRQHEAKGGYILVDTAGDPQWGMLACRNADGLLMLGSQDADPAPNPVEAAAFGVIEPANRSLVMLRARGADPIARTGAWLDRRDAHVHHHVALDAPGDFARLARFLTGRAVGLVLAGGGALGCAHLGIVEGLQRAGIPIDYIGGTSAGAAMGAAIAQGLSVDATLDQMEAMFIHAKAMRRLTVPIHSLLDPRVFDAELRARYSNADIADQPTGFFAISTNLSTNRLHVHRRGPLWEAVRASGSLPTILPPFLDADRNILVDGGVLDNIPVVTMRGIKTGPNIVVALGESDQAWRVEAGYQALRSRGQLLLDVLLRRGPRDDFPSIVEIMQRSMVVASRIASRSMLRPGDILLTPPILPKMQILDWHRGREQAQSAAGYLAQELAENAGLAALAAHK